MTKLFTSRFAGTIFVVVISFLLYLSTLCPTVSFTDAGELAAVTTTLGIAHPTGYPLFTLLGRCAVMVPSGAEEILKLNVLAAVLVALSAGVFFLLLHSILDCDKVFRQQGRLGIAAKHRTPTLILSSLIFSFSTTVWSQSSSVEVYSLHLLLILMIFLTFIKGLQEQAVNPSVTSRNLVLFAFVLGLGFTNHMTTVLLAPAFLFLYAKTLGLKQSLRSRIAKMLPWFILGVSLYLYVPIRSSVRPPFDWGHPISSERFFWHVTGKQYQVWMFEGWDVAKKQLVYFLNHFPQEFHWVVIAVALLGAISLFSEARRLWLFLSFGFLTCILYAINYEIHDIDSYFLLAYVVTSCFVFFGIGSILSWGRRKGLFRVAAIVVTLSLPVFQLLNNRKSADESQNFLAEDITMSILHNVDQNALVFTSLWDYFVSPSYYYQTIRKTRPDVVIIDKALLQNRSWYYLQLERNHPWLLERCRPTVNAFLKELLKFERDEPFNFSIIRSKWSELLKDMVEKSMMDHTVYVDGRILQEFPANLEKHPDGFFFRLARPAEKPARRIFDLNLRPISRQTPVSDDFRQYGAFMLTQNAYALRMEDKTLSLRFLDIALGLLPTYAPALKLRGEL